jgi:hypothetical protein
MPRFYLLQGKELVLNKKERPGHNDTAVSCLRKSGAF